MSRTLLAIVVGFSLGFQVAALSECYGGEPELKAAEPAAVVDPIEAALVQPTEVQYLDTPLPDVVADLKLRHRISIGIDKEALAAGGIAPDSPISHDARDLPLEAVLNRMLANHRLDWTIQEGELFITTPDGARNMPTTRVYSLGRLTTAPGFDYGKLIEIVQGMIAPDSWMANGGANVVRAAPPLQSIVVRADFRAQRRVADLIDVLQRAADNPDERTTAGGLTAGGRDAMDQVLATTIDLHYLDTPIRDVAIHLGIIHKIPFHVNATEIVTNGKGDDLAITADFKGTTLASALTRILSPLLLDWTVTDGVVLITTRTVAESTDFQQVRAYPVGDLVGADGDWNEDANDLIETLTEIATPMDWMFNGGTIADIVPFAVGRTLVVRHSERGHREIAALLAQLRTAKKTAAADGAKVVEPLTLKYYPIADLDAAVRAGERDAVQVHRAQFVEDSAMLVRTLLTEVRPDSWQAPEAGERPTVFVDVLTRSLVVRQTAAGHRGVADFLAKVRRDLDAVVHEAGQAAAATGQGGGGGFY